MRRDVLRIGSLAALGLGFPDLLRLQRNATGQEPTRQHPRKADACILLWLDGGPSHLETFDPKPDAPQEVRGPLDTIATRLPGIRVSDCLPQTASLMNQVAVIRSMTSPLGEHNFGTHYLMTGFKPTPVLEHPTHGAVTAHLQAQQNILPAHIAVPEFRVGGGNLSGNGFLSAATRPFSIGSDPAKPGFQVRDLDFYQGVNLDRLQRRRNYVEALGRLGHVLEKSPAGFADPDLERAFQLITSRNAKEAFNLSAEDDSVRNRYGRRTMGQSCLLARRLVERGVPFVTVNQRGWDTHTELHTRLKLGYVGARRPIGLLPMLDMAFSALVEDLHTRGLLERTLVVVMGEFGRTPKFNANAGRDHWPRVFSVMMAGGGVQGGQVIGSSDAVGENPKDRPVTPSDLAATIYPLLGINPHHELETGDGRPVRITPAGSKAITEITG